MSSVNYIITAKHYGGAKNYIMNTVNAIAKNRGILLSVDFNPHADSVRARIWQGQWIADCECGGASFVEPEEPVFFCFSCANRTHNGRVRNAIFPEQREEIEKLILLRPVNDLAGLDDKERAGLAKPMFAVEGKGGLSRNWNPGQSPQDIEDENKPMMEWLKENK